MPDIETLQYWREFLMVVYYPIAIVSMIYIGLAARGHWINIG